jgi:hypothetical protein
MFRRIFVILVRDSSILNGMTYSSSGDVAVRASVDQIHLLSTATEPEETEDDDNKQEDGNTEQADERAPPTNGFAIADTDSLVLYDWYLNELPDGILIEELPKPGILIAIVSSEGEPAREATESLKYQIRLFAEKANEKLGMRVRNYMVSPDAGFEPIPLKRYDVFLSHDTDDRADALVLRDALKGRGLSCFVASESPQCPCRRCAAVRALRCVEMGAVRGRRIVGRGRADRPGAAGHPVRPGARDHLVVPVVHHDRLEQPRVVLRKRVPALPQPAQAVSAIRRCFAAPGPALPWRGPGAPA